MTVFKRNRQSYFFFIIFTTILGLFSRTSLNPAFIYPYLGDYLYALLYFFIISFLFPQMKPLKVAIISIIACYGIELLQLYQADWINNIRSYRLGGLVLGHGFLWSDMISYTLGGITAFILEHLYYHKDESSI